MGWLIGILGHSGDKESEEEPKNVMKDTIFGLTFRRENYPGSSEEEN